MIQITPYYAAVFGLFFVGLSFRVIRRRQNLKAAFGDARNDHLKRAIRVHGNFSEYVPITLVLISFVEAQTGNAIVTHCLGLLFLLARILHAYGVSHVRENLRYRFLGTCLTGGVICSSSVFILLA